MELTNKLPKFRHPPLIEVVHGVQFPRLKMNITHPGKFFLELRDRFPRAQTVPPLMPAWEMLDSPNGQGQPMFYMPAVNDLPRAWFISNDDTMLVQFQPDRLLLNWRRGQDGQEYPHFDTVAAEFASIYATLERFACSEEIGAVEPDQCEMTYINHLPLAADGSPFGRPEEYLRIFALKNGPEWTALPEDMGATLRYLLRSESGEAFGRLSAKAMPVEVPTGTGGSIHLEITARGLPRNKGFDGVEAFHLAAHEAIVRCFTAITTPAAHEKWERYQ